MVKFSIYLNRRVFLIRNMCNHRPTHFVLLLLEEDTALNLILAKLLFYATIKCNHNKSIENKIKKSLKLTCDTTEWAKLTWAAPSENAS